MRTKRLMAALCAMIICISLILCGCTYEDNNSTYADGKRTDRYVVQYLEITVPETYIKLTSSLRDSDQRWADANISDPSQRKDDYKNRGITAAYYDPETNSTVYFIGKSDSETLSAFDITKYSDEDIVEYAKKLMPAEETIKYEVEAYSHPEMKMFKAKLALSGENGDEELLYGTIVNGMLLQFSMDTAYIGTIKEEVLLKFLSGVHLTEIMTREIYEGRVHKTWTVIGCFFGAGVLLMIILVIITKQRQKRKKKKIAAMSERLYAFRKRKREGEVDMTLLYEYDTDYDKNLIKCYCTYNFWFRTIKRDIIASVIYLAVVGYAIYLGSKVVLILGIAAALFILYTRYSGNEKFQDNLIKRYELKKKKSVTAHYRFYNEFFTMSGIDSLADYSYEQLFRVVNYQGYLLLYISENSALVLDIEKIPEEQREEFIRMIYSKAGNV